MKDVTGCVHVDVSGGLVWRATDRAGRVEGAWQIGWRRVVCGVVSLWCCLDAVGDPIQTPEPRGMSTPRAHSADGAAAHAAAYIEVCNGFERNGRDI